MHHFRTTSSSLQTSTSESSELSHKLAQQICLRQFLDPSRRPLPSFCLDWRASSCFSRSAMVPDVDRPTLLHSVFVLSRSRMLSVLSEGLRRSRYLVLTSRTWCVQSQTGRRLPGRTPPKKNDPIPNVCALRLPPQQLRRSSSVKPQIANHCHTGLRLIWPSSRTCW